MIDATLEDDRPDRPTTAGDTSASDPAAPVEHEALDGRTPAEKRAEQGSTTEGVRGEERQDFTAAESKRLRGRSLRLLGSLVHPLRWRLALMGVVVVISTASQVAGPALIAIGIDRALPALMDQQDWVPAIMVVVVYLITGVIGAVLMAQYTVLSARISQAILIDLRKRLAKAEEKALAEIAREA